MTGDPPASIVRAPDLVLARVHLRLGSLSLARAELETLAGRDQLDLDGVVDLAEARWRTGDLSGAGEAAALVLHDEDGPILALVVAAEAAAARGRPTEARRLAARAIAMADGSIDAIFAGMPRSPAWPPDPAAPPPSATTMFDGPSGASGRTASTGRRRTARERPTTEPPAPEDVTAPDDDATAAIGLWDEGLAAEAEAEAEAQAAIDATLPTGEEALERGRAALDGGDMAAAALQLALVLRVAPVLAPAVLDVTAGRDDAELALVRGDAYRLVGRELDARRAYAQATRPDPPPSEGAPA